MRVQYHSRVESTTRDGSWSQSNHTSSLRSKKPWLHCWNGHEIYKTFLFAVTYSTVYLECCENLQEESFPVTYRQKAWLHPVNWSGSVKSFPLQKEGSSSFVVIHGILDDMSQLIPWSDQHPYFLPSWTSKSLLQRHQGRFVQFCSPPHPSQKYASSEANAPVTSYFNLNWSALGKRALVPTSNSDLHRWIKAREVDAWYTQVLWPADTSFSFKSFSFTLQCKILS